MLHKKIRDMYKYRKHHLIEAIARDGEVVRMITAIIFFALIVIVSILL